MVKIYNGTPHKISVYNKEQVEERPEIRKLVIKPGEKPVLEIESSGILSAKIEYEKFDNVSGIDLYRMKVLACGPIPEEYDIVIVSALYATAAKELGLNGTDKLYTVSQPVYSDGSNPRPIGCLGLNKV